MILGHPPFDDRRGDFDEIYRKITGSEPKFRGIISANAKVKMINQIKQLLMNSI